MAAGMIRLSMDPLCYAHPPAELHAAPERFPPCSHDSPCLPCEGADADDPSLPRASTVPVIAEDNTPSLPHHGLQSENGIWHCILPECMHLTRDLAKRSPLIYRKCGILIALIASEHYTQYPMEALPRAFIAAPRCAGPTEVWQATSRVGAGGPHRICSPHRASFFGEHLA